MSVFTVYVIFVTILLVGYYAVTIYKDLHAKKEPVNPSEEVFDLSSMQEDEAVPVSETSQGFQVGTSEDDLPGEEDAADDSGEGEERDKVSPDASEEKARQVTENLEDADIKDEVALKDVEFQEYLLSENKRGTLFRDDAPQTQPGPDPGEITI